MEFKYYASETTYVGTACTALKSQAGEEKLHLRCAFPVFKKSPISHQGTGCDNENFFYRHKKAALCEPLCKGSKFF